MDRSFHVYFMAGASGVLYLGVSGQLSKRGNPRLSTLVAVTKAIGLRLTVEPAR